MGIEWMGMGAVDCLPAYLLKSDEYDALIKCTKETIISFLEPPFNLQGSKVCTKYQEICPTFRDKVAETYVLEAGRLCKRWIAKMAFINLMEFIPCFQ